jgi:hypothetical protein
MKKVILLNTNESNYKSNYRYNIILIDLLYIIASNLAPNIVNQHPERIPSFFNDSGTYFNVDSIQGMKNNKWSKIK